MTESIRPKVRIFVNVVRVEVDGGAVTMAIQLHQQSTSKTTQRDKKIKKRRKSPALVTKKENVKKKMFSISYKIKKEKQEILLQYFTTLHKIQNKYYRL